MSKNYHRISQNNGRDDFLVLYFLIYKKKVFLSTMTSTKLKLYLTILHGSAKILTVFYLRIALKSKKKYLFNNEIWSYFMFINLNTNMMARNVGKYIIRYIIENEYNKRNIIFTFYLVFKKYSVSIHNVK